MGSAVLAFRDGFEGLESKDSMIVETPNRAHVANPAAAQLPKSPKTKAFEGVVMYYGYRFYDPETGRWPSRDPIGEAGGMNLYGFGPNRPINGFDLLGWVWLNPTPGTVGDMGYIIPDDLGRLVDRDYGGRNVEPGPPTGNCIEDIAKSIAWYESAREAGYSDSMALAKARLDEVLKKCRERPDPSPNTGKPYDPNCCFCKSGIWEGVLTYGTIGLMLNKGKFTGTMTCSGEPDKKMIVEGDAWGLGLFFGWSGENKAHMKMLGNLPSDLKGTSQGCLLDIGGGISILSAGVNFPISPSGTGQPFRLPSPNIGGLDLPLPGHAGSLGFPKKLPSKIGTGFNWVGFNVVDAHCVQ